MSEKPEDDGWEKVREMVRNAPPPTAQVPFQPDQPHPELPKRSPVGRILLMMFIIGVLGAGYYAWTQYEPEAQSPSSAAPDSKPTVPATASAEAPTAVSEPAPKAVGSATVRKGLKSVNVRSGPSPSSAPVGRIAGGQQVEKLSET